MTEAEWLTATDPGPMLEFLAGRASDRRLRLFAVACTRRMWDRASAPGRAAVEVAQRFADGLATAGELRAARLRCKDDGGGGAWYAAASRPDVAARNAALSALAAGDPAAERAAQAELLRDVIGNPFRPEAFDPRWRTTDVLTLSLAVYDEQAFDRLPSLADALVAAGCDDEALIGHCRSPGPHVRGCWAVDLVLGKR